MLPVCWCKAWINARFSSPYFNLIRTPTSTTHRNIVENIFLSFWFHNNGFVAFSLFHSSCICYVSFDVSVSLMLILNPNFVTFIIQLHTDYERNEANGREFCRLFHGLIMGQCKMEPTLFRFRFGLRLGQMPKKHLTE